MFCTLFFKPKIITQKKTTPEFANLGVVLHLKPPKINILASGTNSFQHIAVSRTPVQS